MNRKNGAVMSSKTIKILVAYVAGQVTQLVVHAMCLNFNMWANRQIPFCTAAGFVVFFAILCGAWIAKDRDEKPAHEKTYKEWAEIPTDDDIDEVVFSANKK